MANLLLRVRELNSLRYLTEEEIAALDDLKSKFDAQTTELDKATKELDLYKAEPEKLEILNSADYAVVKDTEEFAELSKRENYFSLTKDELSQKLDGMLVEFAKKKSREVKPESKPEVGVKRFGFGDTEKRNSRYGGFFDKK